jgi:hypothetical protein
MAGAEREQQYQLAFPIWRMRSAHQIVRIFPVVAMPPMGCQLDAMSVIKPSSFIELLPPEII